jgi:hypothetical protein
LQSHFRRKKFQSSIKSVTENQSSTKDHVTFEFFSEMNAALSGIIRSLDFCSPFHQGKGEIIFSEGMTQSHTLTIYPDGL